MKKIFIGTILLFILNNYQADSCVKCENFQNCYYNINYDKIINSDGMHDELLPHNQRLAKGLAEAIHTSFFHINKTKAGIESKAINYFLNLNHAQGVSKATFFKDMLGYANNEQDRTELVNLIYNQIDISLFTFKGNNPYGITYNQIMDIKSKQPEKLGKHYQLLVGFILCKDGALKMTTVLPYN